MKEKEIIQDTLIKDNSKDDLNKNHKARASNKINNSKSHYYVQYKDNIHQVYLDSPRTRQALEELGLEEEQFKEINDTLIQLNQDSSQNADFKQIRMDHFNKRMLRLIDQINEQRKQIINKEEIKERLRNRSRMYTDMGISQPNQKESYYLSGSQLKTENSPFVNKSLRRVQALGERRENQSFSQDRSFLNKTSAQAKIFPQEYLREYQKTINYLKNSSKGPNIISASQVLNGNNQQQHHQNQQQVSQFQGENSFELPLEKELDTFNKFKKLTQFKAMQEYNQEMKRVMMKKQEEIRQDQIKIQLKMKMRQLEEENKKKKEALKWKLFDMNEEKEKQDKQNEIEKNQLHQRLEKKKEMFRKLEEQRIQEREIKSQQRKRRQQQVFEKIEYIQYEEIINCDHQKKEIEDKLQCTEESMRNNLQKVQEKLKSKFERNKEVFENGRLTKQQQEEMRVNTIIERIVKHEENKKMQQIKKIKKQMKNQEELQQKLEKKMEAQQEKMQQDQKKEASNKERQKQIEEYHRQRQLDEQMLSQLKQEQLRLKDLEIKENEELRQRQQEIKFQNLQNKYKRMEEFKIQKQFQIELIRKAKEQSTIQLQKETKRINENIQKVTHNLAVSEIQNKKDKTFDERQKKILMRIVPEEQITKSEELQKQLLNSFSQKGKPKDKLLKIIQNQDQTSLSPNATIIN